MNWVLRTFILIVGALYCAFVLRLLLRKKINEKNTIVWMAGAVFIFLLSAYPEVLNLAAAELGIDYPPTLLFLMSIMVLLILVLYQSMQISVLNEKLRELSQYVALLQNKQSSDARGTPSAEDKPQAHEDSGM